jgi:hypothetical protein
MHHLVLMPALLDNDSHRRALRRWNEGGDQHDGSFRAALDVKVPIAGLACTRAALALRSFNRSIVQSFVVQRFSRSMPLRPGGTIALQPAHRLRRCLHINAPSRGAIMVRRSLRIRNIFPGDALSIENGAARSMIATCIAYTAAETCGKS